MTIKLFEDCRHERLEGDVAGGQFDDHRTTRGICPDCVQYVIVTDYFGALSTCRRMTQDEKIAWHKEIWHDVGCHECETEFGETHRDECGDECKRAPGSDICLSCTAKNDAMVYYGSLYKAGALGPIRSDYDDREEFEAAVALAFPLRNV